MTDRAKRLTLTLGVATAVAVIAGSVMVPDTVAAPKKEKPGGGKPSKGKPLQPGPFVIEVSEEGVCCGYLGTFEATGAIQDTGSAGESWCDPRNEVSLSGDLGNMEMVITDDGDTFQIVYADGRYASLLGVTGSHYTPDHEPTSWVYRRFEGSVPE